MPPSILSTHMPPSEVTCWFYSPKLLKKCQNCDFSCTPFWRGFLGVEISNRPNKVRVSKNRENHVFEYIVLEYVESSGEQPPTLRKMFRGHLGVENSILLNPYFGPKRNFEWKWKSTLQRWAFSGKLGFWQNFGGPRGAPHKKKSAEAKKFFFA